ncbi:MAG TPA: Ku protein [Opitutaceae bacterium]|nr:Ku protein [Opitutaceae bacterium]
MRAIWKGAISFGLVNIPVGLQNATSREEIKFRLLRSSDLSPVNFRRVAQLDGKEVPWAQIVKGYEYEKGKFVVLKDEDFRRVDLEATDTIDIVDFVDLSSIDPMFFYRPYYLEPEKGGAGAYGLLREVLAKTGKVGIAKIVIKTRQHLAAVRPDGPLLVLELMHFADELIDRREVKVPEKKPAAREIAMATALVKQMSEEWDPSRYTDDYASALMKLIHQKVESGGKELPTRSRSHPPASNVIDLASVLQESLQRAGHGKPGKGAAAKRKRKKAA